MTQAANYHFHFNDTFPYSLHPASFQFNVADKLMSERPIKLDGFVINFDSTCTNKANGVLAIPLLFQGIRLEEKHVDFSLNYS
jgi:hypothetical protein